MEVLVDTEKVTCYTYPINNNTTGNIMNLLQTMLNSLFEQVYLQLDNIELHEDCPTREMSWDEAAVFCTSLAEEEGQEIERDMYLAASEIYAEAVTVWDAINDSRKLFTQS